MISLSEIQTIWEQFFYSSTSPETLGLFRILLGCLVIFDAIHNIKNVRTFYGINGVFSFEHYMKNYRYSRLSLFCILPATDLTVISVYCLHCLAAAAFTLGLLTKISLVIVCITLTSLHHRNPFCLNGGDNVLRIYCFLTLFTPCENIYSLDVILLDLETQTNTSIWPIRILQLFVISIYFKSVYWKLKGQTWRIGTAIYYPLKTEALLRITLPNLFERKSFYMIITLITLFIESSLFTFIWIEEFRYPAIICGILLHLSIELFLNIHLFSWVMITGLILFIEPVNIKNLLTFLDIF